MRTWSDVGIDESLLNPDGESKIPCPRCRPTSQHPERRCLNVNTTTGEWKCWDDGGQGCGFKGNLNAASTVASRSPGEPVVRIPQVKKSQYRRITRDEYVQATEVLPQIALDWLHKRGISDDAIRTSGLRWGPITKVGNRWIMGIWYPYGMQRDGEKWIANIKKRCLCCKDHMQLMGAKDGLSCELVFYGQPNMDDTTVFVEGELDALACITAGIRNVVSVPNGATMASDTSRLSYMEACQREMDAVRHAILFFDADQPGRTLRDEFARRHQYQKCSYVVPPDDCKDANDVLLKYGPEKLVQLIQDAKPFPVEGLIRPLDMADQLHEWLQDGMPSGHSTGWPSLDEYYRVILGQLNIVTGIPGSGKSAVMDALLLNLWRIHRWRVLVFSPEHYPPSTHLVKLAQIMTGLVYDRKHFAKWQSMGFEGTLMEQDDLDVALLNLQDGFTWISPEIDGKGHDLQGLLRIAAAEIYRTGAKVFVIDPWNEIEHHMPRGMNKTDYIGECLTYLRRFARHHNIALYVVAHPTKIERKPEKIKDKSGKEITIYVEPIPTAYDIADSANWFNKADNILTIWRDKYAHLRGSNPHLNTIDVQKIKTPWGGRLGMDQLLWDPMTGRYSEYTLDAAPLDSKKSAPKTVAPEASDDSKNLLDEIF